MTFLSKDEIKDIHSTSLEILEKTGILVRNPTALSILKKAACETEADIVKLPISLIEESLGKCPRKFILYSQDTEHEYIVGDDHVLYNPGSSVPNILDHTSRTIRKALAQDFIESISVTNELDKIAAQSTSIIPSDIPEMISDFYRLYTVPKYSQKPVITGAFRKEGVPDMLKLLQSGDQEEDWNEKPTAIFDCCPTSPLTWSDTSGQHLIDCAKAGIPAEIVPAPLMGATSPITIAGTLAQSNAEVLSGLVIAQLVNSGCPVVYGGAPSPLDMRHATPRFGSIESIMTACASAEIGKHYGLPTHAYLGISDSKAIDAQLGFESAVGLILGALSRINIISGPGALAFIKCQSLEKLVIDNEICGTAFRLMKGIDFNDFHIIYELVASVVHSGDFLKQRHTSKKLRQEHFMPSNIIDRVSEESWMSSGAATARERAKKRVDELLNDAPSSDNETVQQLALRDTMKSLVTKYGVTAKL